MSYILVTGANGFVGSCLCNQLIKRNYFVRAALRRAYPQNGINAQERSIVGDIGPDTNWNEVLTNIDTVVHLAARVHITTDSRESSLVEYRKVNREGTTTLAKAAVDAGVRRFVYLSTIKVNGESVTGNAFTENDTPRPQDAYAMTKWEAEQGLWDIAKDTGLEVVILRPPLVYGPEVKANFYKLMNLIYKRVPLPLSSIRNRRSFISIDNLVDLIMSCIEHPRAAGETFLVSDDEDLSTPELINRIGKVLGIHPRLFPMPLMLLNVIAGILGKKELLNRLTESLWMDSRKAGKILDWTPPYSVDESLAKTANWYKRQLAEE